MSLINNRTEQKYKWVEMYNDQREPLCNAILKIVLYSRYETSCSQQDKQFIFLSLVALHMSITLIWMKKVLYQFIVMGLSNRKWILLCYFVGKMPPVLACRALSQISVFCGRSNGRVQHAAVYSEGVQGHRCKGKLT